MELDNTLCSIIVKYVKQSEAISLTAMVQALTRDYDGPIPDVYLEETIAKVGNTMKTPTSDVIIFASRSPTRKYPLLYLVKAGESIETARFAAEREITLLLEDTQVTKREQKARKRHREEVEYELEQNDE